MFRFIKIALCLIILGCNQKNENSKNIDKEKKQIQTKKNDTVSINTLQLKYERITNSPLYVYSEKTYQLENVINLKLFSSDTIKSISLFTSLKHLDYQVDLNTEKHSLPEDFCDCDSLQVIDYICHDETKMKADLTKMKCLKNLFWLSIFTSIDVPDELQEFKKMEVLIITGKTKTFPYFIAKMPNLKFILITGSLIPIDEQKKVINQFEGIKSITFLEDDFRE